MSTLYSWAANEESLPSRLPTPELPYLTLELLQERLKAPTQSEGFPILNLRQLNIDLRPENASFRDQFYERLQVQLQRPGSPLGLDLSYSQIQGEFALGKLGLRAPLYGQALLPIFSPTEQAQLQRDRRRLSQSQLSHSSAVTPNTSNQPVLPPQITVFRGPVKLMQTRFLGPVDAANIYFLNRLEAQGADFIQDADWSATRFSQPVNFIGAVFHRKARLRNTIFFDKAGFGQGQFRGVVNFQGSEFQSTAQFNQTLFQFANFSQVQWKGNADFSQSRWQDQALFTEDKFLQSLFLTESTFEQAVLFREVQFQKPVHLRGASILNRADFSYSDFAEGAYLNVTGLEFDSAQAKILGVPGEIGQMFFAPTLSGNETLFRNLVQNFRQLQQISDANQVEYTIQQLRLGEISQKFWGTNINTADVETLVQLGFSGEQATEIAQERTKLPFRSLSELLNLETIDVDTYIKVSTRAIAEAPLPPVREAMHEIDLGWKWLGLSLLLRLSGYGSSFLLVFGVGLVAIAYFSMLFWFLDRWRRLRPTPIVSTWTEVVWVLSSSGLLALAGVSAIFSTADQPWWTLLFLSILTLPLPLLLLFLVYYRGRYHDLLDVSYFVEEGTLRQLRLLIGRLPTVPRYDLFRERYMPIHWDRRWSWLNYYDFSLNNLFKFGFNDIRLRDEHLPGLISSLVWYQWSLGFLYIALLLWTLSRTIPGLNLLIYLK